MYKRNFTIRRTLTILLAVSMSVAVNNAKGQARDAQGIANLINGITGITYYGLTAVASGNTVTITGNSSVGSDHSRQINFEMTAGTIVVWQASHDGNLLLRGAGTLKIESGLCGARVDCQTVDIEMSGGVVRGVNGLWPALRGNANITITGGTIEHLMGTAVVNNSVAGTTNITHISGNPQLIGGDWGVNSTNARVEFLSGTITVNHTQYTSCGGISIGVNNHLKMTGGSISVSTNSSSNIDVRGIGGGTVELLGGTISVTQNDPTRNAYGISVTGTGKITISGGTVTANGGKECYGLNAAGAANITGGSISASGGTTENYGVKCLNFDMSGGAVSASGTGAFGAWIGGKVTGGTISNGVRRIMLNDLLFLAGTIQGTIDPQYGSYTHTLEISALSIPSSWDGTNTGITRYDTIIGNQNNFCIWDLSDTVPLILYRAVEGAPNYDTTTVATKPWGRHQGGSGEEPPSVKTGSTTIGTSGTGSISLGLEIEEPLQFSGGNFTLTMPSGFSLDEGNTALSAAFASEFEMSITPQTGNSWLIDIVPSGSPSPIGKRHKGYQNIVDLSFTVAETVIDGDYFAHIAPLLFHFTDGSDLNETDIPINILVKRTVGIAVGVNDYLPLRIYPNPVSYKLQVTNYEGEEIQIFNLVGQCVMSIESLPFLEPAIDVSGLSAGMYYLKIDDRVVKFVKE